MAAPKLLVVTRHSPLPGNDGAGAYLFDLLSYLARSGFRIEVAWIKAEEEYLKNGYWRVPSRLRAVANFTVVGSLAVGPYRFFWWGPLKARVLGAIKASLQTVGLWRQRSHQPAPAAASTGSRPPIPTQRRNDEPEWSELPSLNETRFFEERLHAFRPDAVLANYCWLLPLFPRGLTAQKFVLTHDVASQRLNLNYTRGGNGGGDFSPATPEGEARLLRLADVILAISEEDAKAFRALCPDRVVLVAPKSAAAQPLAGPTVDGRCLFVGGVNPPNREGLAWFLEKIWPEIRRQSPEAILHVCGGICQTVDAPPPGVRLLGRIESLDTEYAAAQVVVVPLLQGTGVKIKLVEACSHGKACVTTPVGLQGLDFLRPGVVETDTPEKFASNVSRLLADSVARASLEKTVIELVRQHLSPDGCFSATRDVMRRPRALPPVPARTPAPTSTPTETPSNSLHGEHV